MTYAAGPAGSGLVTEELTTDYHGSTGLPVRLDTSLTGAAGTLLSASYTAYSEVNGSVRGVAGTTAAEDVIYRDEATRRIERTTTTDVSDRRYTHDPYGNVTEITETPASGPADKQCFRHDRLSQLSRAWTPRPDVACSDDPAVADLGGPAPYWTDWTFDTTGSRLTEVSHARAGDTTRTFTVPAGGADVARPHALTEMTTTAPGQPAVVNRYSYDQAGNTVCRAAGTGANDCGTGAGSQVAAWDAEGRMATITAGGTVRQANVHDVDGTRLIRRDQAGATLYLPGQEIRQQGTTVTGTRHYSFAGGVIASRKGGSAAADLSWLYADHQGTHLTAVNAATHVATVRRQTPYGGPRGAQPAWPTGKSFVGGDDDVTGLVHLGAREYDPVTGRFISVDPLMDLSDPTQWNGYSYANNSPVSSSDPDGLAPCHGYQDGDLCPGQKVGPWAGTVAGDTARDKHFGGGTKNRKRDNSYTGNRKKGPGTTAVKVAKVPGRYMANEIAFLDDCDCDPGYLSDDIDYIIKIAAEAGIDPRMLIAILEHEGSGRDLGSFASTYMEENQVGLGLGGSIGIGQVQEAAFNTTVANHAEVFGDAKWYDMIHDDELGMKIAAYHIKDLQSALDAVTFDDATQVRGRSRHELVAYGYNSGGANMLQAATGRNEFVRNSYMDKFAHNWKRADRLLCGSSFYQCG